MPQSTVFCVFVGAGEEAIKYQETTRDTHTCLKLISPTHNHESHERKKKKKTTRQHSLEKHIINLWILPGQLFNPFHTSFACVHVKHVSTPPSLTHTHTCTHAHAHICKTRPKKPKRNKHMSKEPRKRIILREFWHIIHNP